MNNTTIKYDALNGVRVIAIIGILVMHVCANLPYNQELSNVYQYIVYFGDFTSLFMVVSAFSISCGYYNKIVNGNFDDICAFYKKRFIRIFPFFATLSIIDIIVSPSKESIIECIANFTLGFGLLPHYNISVIGVGWTLGVIFAFYLLYPFFVYCMKSKKRYLILLLISIFYGFISNAYFDLKKVEFLFCLVYFVVGCGLFLIRDRIVKLNRWMLLSLTIIFGVFFFLCYPIPHNISKLIFMTLITMYAVNVSGKHTILSNSFMNFINNYSFEMYLSHMFAYRILEKLNMLKMFNNCYVSYITVCVLTFLLSLGVSYSFKYVENKVLNKLIH